jgi:chaperonin cofactor prefoldin
MSPCDNPYKVEMDELLDEIREHEELLWELNQVPQLEADRRQIRKRIADLQVELAHYDIAREAEAGE